MTLLRNNVLKNVSMKSGIIDSFDDKYAFLSNDYPVEIVYNDKSYKSVEAAYHAQKCDGILDDFTELSAEDSRKLGRSIPLKDNWDNLKLRLMTELLFIKFSNQELMDMLKSTYNCSLINENSYDDTYWGVDHESGIGENHLGKILMNIRDMKETYLYDIALRLRKNNDYSYVITLKVVACDDSDAYEKAQFYVNSGNSGYVFNYIENIWFNGSRMLVPI